MSALFSRKKQDKIDAFLSEYEKIQNAPQLAPNEINGLALTYHYKDVRIRAPYNLSGKYGEKSVAAIGARRGDMLTLVFDPRTVDGEKDPLNVAVMWKKTKIGDMRNNRMRDMVHEWRQAKLPIFCAMAYPAPDRGFFLEFGFYGKPGKS